MSPCSTRISARRADWLRRAVARLEATSQGRLRPVPLRDRQSRRERADAGAGPSRRCAFPGRAGRARRRGRALPVQRHGGRLAAPRHRGAGGWSADTLAEDLDLALRAYACGLARPARADAADRLARRRRAIARLAGAAAALVAGLRRGGGERWPRRAVPAPGARLATMLLLGLQLALPAFLAVIVGFVGDTALARLRHGARALLAGCRRGWRSAALVAMTLPPFLALAAGQPEPLRRGLCGPVPLLLGLAFANSAAVLAAPFGVRAGFRAHAKKSGPSLRSRRVSTDLFAASTGSACRSPSWRCSAGSSPSARPWRSSISSSGTGGCATPAWRDEASAPRPAAAAGSGAAACRRADPDLQRRRDRGARARCGDRARLAARAADDSGPRRFDRRLAGLARRSSRSAARSVTMSS